MIRILISPAVVAASLTIAAARHSHVPDAVLRSGTLSFTGHSTFGTFVGTTSAARGAFIAGSEIGSGRGWVEAPVATLATGNDHRDRDMRSTMEVDKFPTIRFDLATLGLESKGSAADSDRATLNGRLAIHGVSRAVSIRATLRFIGDTIDVAGGFPVDLTDYRIGGLTRFFGAVRMEKGIEVSFHLRFTAAPRAAGERNW